MAAVIETIRLTRRRGTAIGAYLDNNPTIPNWFVFVVIILATLVTRVSAIGDPVVHIDDQFYSVVGQLMLRGEIPYVDVWDRKPIGLFIIYAAFAKIGGSSPFFYQTIAALFAATSAYLIKCIATRIASHLGALLAATAYLAFLVPFGGQSGQSPVFYNVLIVGAALLFIRTVEAERTSTVWNNAIGAMVCCGLAMSIKQISFVEGGFIGTSFLVLTFRRGWPVARIAALASVMLAIALLPTLLALGWYWSHGFLDEFVFANFTSIFLKHGTPYRYWGLVYYALFLFALIILAIAGSGIRRRRAGPDRSIPLFIDLWLLASVVGTVSIPNFYDHYALPLLQPLTVSAATILGSARGLLMTISLFGLAASEGRMFSWAEHGKSALAYEKLSSLVDSHLKGGCLFVAGGPPILYSLSHACRLTPYLFSEHLMRKSEANAVRIDTFKELARILALNPAVIVHRTIPWDDYDPDKVAIVQAKLDRDYRQIGEVRANMENQRQVIEVWERKVATAAPPPRN